MSGDTSFRVVGEIGAPDKEKVIAMLEAALAEVRAGTIEGIVLVTHYREREWRGQWAGISYHAGMGYLARLIYKMNQTWDGQA